VKQAQANGGPRMERTRHPGIYRRGSRYVVVWQHRGKQHKSFHRTLAEAREAKGNRDSGDRRPASREPFEDHARAWLASYRGRTSRGFSERTRRLYLRDLERHAFPYFAGRRLAEVEPQDVRAFVGHLEAKGLAPSSVRAVLAPVKAMYADAFEDGAVRANPTRVRVRGRHSADDTKAKAMTRAELLALLAELPDEWLLFFELLAHSGLRISEAIGLEWRDVRFGDRPGLLVRRQDCRGEVGELKSDGARRDIPLSPGMAARLWRLGADRPATDRVFTSPLGTPLRASNLHRRVLVPARDRAGLRWVSFHAFRHTCASLLFGAGRNVAQVAAWLGHADPAFTLRTYVHLMDDGVGDAAFLDQAVSPGSLGRIAAEVGR
jgi:integrase